MSDRDFKIGERNFKLNKIDALKQFSIVRKISPILGELIPAMGKIGNQKVNPDQLSDEQLQMLSPVIKGFSNLSDTDANAVLLALCSSVEMQQMPLGNWARVSTDSMILFQDLELPVLFQIAWRAFQFNLTGFFNANQQISHGGK